LDRSKKAGEIRARERERPREREERPKPAQPNKEPKRQENERQQQQQQQHDSNSNTSLPISNIVDKHEERFEFDWLSVTANAVPVVCVFPQLLDFFRVLCVMAAGPNPESKQRAL